MDNFLERWLFDPILGKLVVSGVGLLLVVAAVRILKRVSSRYVTDANARYRLRKYIGLAGYLAGVFVLATVFSDKLVAGAGIGFALQEVIASVA